MSFRLNDEIAILVGDTKPPIGRRAVLATIMCRVALDHGNGQRILVMTDHVVTALALVRVQFEAVVRATWMLHGATQEWLERFTTPKAPGVFDETVMGPPVDSMLNAIDASAPTFVGKMLREFKNATWKPMNSFVHGGVHAVANAMIDTPPENLVSLLRNANGLSFLAAQILVIASSDPDLAGRIRSIQTANIHALPPTST